MTTNPIPYLTAYLAHARQKGCDKLIAVLEELIEETKKELCNTAPNNKQ